MAGINILNQDLVKKIGFLSLLWISVFSYTHAQERAELVKQFESHIQLLASDSLQGREMGTKGGQDAAAYITAQMKAKGLKPYGKLDSNSSERSWLQPFISPKNKQGNNVIGYLAANTVYTIVIGAHSKAGIRTTSMLAANASYTIVIGAHYDHLGMGGEGSLSPDSGAVHNGADDNASGVAMMLELAEKLQQLPSRKYNYLFIAFDGEEKGLLGSNYYAKHPTLALENVNCMINMDMVGRLDPAKNTIGINGTGTSLAWDSVLTGIRISPLKIKTSASGIGPSDHTSFYLKDIPVLHFFSGTHEDYHKPSDDLEKINYSGMVYIYDFLWTLLSRLEELPKLDFQATPDDNHGKNTPRFSVTLGVIPDYLYDGEGMRIDGVRSERPAAKAGIKDGDIVIKMGDHEIHDMMSYMKALSKFEKGDKVKVLVRRGDKTIGKKVKF